MDKTINGSHWQVVLIGDPVTGLPLAQFGGIQQALLTDNGGSAQRMKVDLAQTSFFQGLMYRYFRRLNIPLGSSFVIKLIASKDYVVYKNSATIKSGDLDVSVKVNCIETSSFTTPIQVRRCNQMSTAPNITTGLSVMIGGTIDLNSGEEINTYGTSTANGIGSTASSVGDSASDEIGVSTNSTTYLIFTAVNGGVGATAVAGTHYFRFEERQP